MSLSRFFFRKTGKSRFSVPVFFSKEGFKKNPGFLDIAHLLGRFVKITVFAKSKPRFFFRRGIFGKTEIFKNRVNDIPAKNVRIFVGDCGFLAFNQRASL